ncbi:MAG: WD40/YVTN/BNR-like repeat-containing protein, partial [Myxococcales bacterium]
RGMVCLDPQTCWFAGATGTVVRTEDGGKTFLRTTRFGMPARSPTAAPYILNAIARASDGTLVAVGSTGAIARSTNGGVTFTTVTTSNTSTLNDVRFAGRTGYAVGLSGTVLKTTDAGLTWTRLTLPTGSSSTTFNGLALLDENNFIAVGASGRILRTANGGVSFTEPASNTTNALNAVTIVPGATSSEPYVAYAAGSAGTVRKSVDSGVTWTTSTTLSQTLNAIAALDANTVITGGVASTTGPVHAIRRSTDGGATWSNVALPHGNSPTVTSLRFLRNGSLDAFAVGTAGLLLRSSDGGATWSVPSGGLQATTDIIRTVQFPSTNVGYMFGSNGFAARTGNGGQTWTTLDVDPAVPCGTSTTTEYVYASQFLTDSVGYVVGTTQVPSSCGTQMPLVARTTNGGQTWTQLPLPSNTARIMYDVHFLDENNGMVVGASGAIWRWNGTAFVTETVSGYTTTTWRTVKMLSPTSAIVTGNTNIVAVWDGTTLTTETAPSSSGNWLVSSALLPNNVFVAIGDLGSIVRRTTSGWTLVGTGFSGQQGVSFSADGLTGVSTGSSGSVLLTLD